MLERYRRTQKEGAHSYWSVTETQGISSFRPDRTRVDLLLFGDCEIQMESDFLRQDAARRNIDLRVAATFASDVALASERKCDAVIVGALNARKTVADKSVDGPQIYASEMRALVTKLRSRTEAPILIDNLPEPTVQPLGFAERGTTAIAIASAVANLALAELAENFADVHVVDVAAALAGSGTERLLDDGLVVLHAFRLARLDAAAARKRKGGRSRHLSPIRAARELRWTAIPMAARPWSPQRISTRSSPSLGIDRKKCVIVDLDGTLWPGVLAETGAPFAWHPEISGAHSYVGLFFRHARSAQDA